MYIYIYIYDDDENNNYFHIEVLPLLLSSNSCALSRSIAKKMPVQVAKGQVILRGLSLNCCATAVLSEDQVTQVETISEVYILSSRCQ